MQPPPELSGSGYNSFRTLGYARNDNRKCSRFLLYPRSCDSLDGGLSTNNLEEMSVKSFDELVVKLEDGIKSEDAKLRVAITPAEMLAITSSLSSLVVVVLLHTTARQFNASVHSATATHVHTLQRVTNHSMVTRLTSTRECAGKRTPSEHDVGGGGAGVREESEEYEVVQVDSFHEDERVIGHDAVVPQARQHLAHRILEHSSGMSGGNGSSRENPSTRDIVSATTPTSEDPGATPPGNRTRVRLSVGGEHPSRHERTHVAVEEEGVAVPVHDVGGKADAVDEHHVLEQHDGRPQDEGHEEVHVEDVARTPQSPDKWRRNGATAECCGREVGVMLENPRDIGNVYSTLPHIAGTRTRITMAGYQRRRGKQEIPEKNRRPVASSGKIPSCENPIRWFTVVGDEYCESHNKSHHGNAVTSLINGFYDRNIVLEKTTPFMN
ncbi:hypothetical protein PR048_027815 [Dryococelus australis]|uniref:Uncharacterized protein n=1 Tax=Dryococelus australis TaxID=614101 RepID=A0ABQ9GHK2_9NEOP|nr:hypothetical protein PR048_027815 [Dryococelus australis]